MVVCRLFSTIANCTTRREIIDHAITLQLYYRFFFCCQEFGQYRIDVDNLIAEKNDLGESFLHQSFPTDMDGMLDASSHKVFHYLVGI